MNASGNISTQVSWSWLKGATEQKKIKGLSYERFHGWAKPRCVLPNGAVQEELSGCILWMLRGKLNDLVQNFMTTNVGSALLSYFFERCEYIYNIEICFFFT